jgi:hypothetical protein
MNPLIVPGITILTGQGAGDEDRKKTDDKTQLDCSHNTSELIHSGEKLSIDFNYRRRGGMRERGFKRRRSNPVNVAEVSQGFSA